MKKNKKILFVINYYLPNRSGMTAVAQEFSEFLVNEGYEVTVFCWGAGKEAKEEVINGVQVKRFHGLLKFDKGIISPKFWFALLTQARRYDIVIPFLPMPESVLLRFLPKRIQMVPYYICDIQLNSGLLSRIIQKITYWSMSMLLKKSETIMALSKDYASKSPAIREIDKVISIPPPIPFQDRNATPPEDFLKHYPQLKKKKRIGFAGRIVEEKGLDILFDALALTPEFFKEYDIVIAGNYHSVPGGSLYDKLIKMKPEGLSIEFIGFLPDELLNSFYSSLDLFVLPSKGSMEAYGIVQAEAMLCGAPVVSTNLPGVRMIVKDTRFGELAEPGDAKTLNEALRRVLEDRRKFLPRREDVMERLQLKSTYEKFGQLIAQLSLVDQGSN